MKDYIINWINSWFSQNSNLTDGSVFLKLIILSILAVLLGWIIWRISWFIIKNILYRYAVKTKTSWDDELVDAHFFRLVAHLIPALFAYEIIGVIFNDYPSTLPFFEKIVDVLIAFILMRITLSFLTALTKVLSKNKKYKDKPIASYVQLGKVFVYISGFIFIFSILFEKSPLYLLSAMGAMTAVLILIFKDTILGFVASIQISSYDMIRVGDWVTMEKFGADGDVVEINLTTVKIQNFDKTITTVPTYSIISDSFKNWRGMQESDGRRVKRAVNIKINSVRFCDDDLLSHIRKIQLIKDIISDKEQEISRYNKDNNIDKSLLINGRNLTNLGIFRVYVEQYLLKNQKINSKMTCMVRQLSPTERGIPIEIYAFTETKEWEEYEKVVSDIFDHICAASHEFGLEIFENPSGKDFQIIGKIN